jgi:hypothetical protein
MSFKVLLVADLLMCSLFRVHARSGDLLREPDQNRGHVCDLSPWRASWPGKWRGPKGGAAHFEKPQLSWGFRDFSGGSPGGRRTADLHETHSKCALLTILPLFIIAPSYLLFQQHSFRLFPDLLRCRCIKESTEMRRELSLVAADCEITGSDALRATTVIQFHDGSAAAVNRGTEAHRLSGSYLRKCELSSMRKNKY